MSSNARLVTRLGCLTMMNSFGRHRLRSIAPLCLALVLCCVLAGTAEACPSCKAALANQNGGAKMVQGFMWSILFMLAMPFTIFGSLSTYFYYLVRRARREQEALANQSAGAPTSNLGTAPGPREREVLAV